MSATFGPMSESTETVPDAWGLPVGREAGIGPFQLSATGAQSCGGREVLETCSRLR